MVDLLAQYGVVLVFAWVFAVQAGMPIPAGPMLLGAGALSGSGQMNLPLAVGAAIAAALGADVIWYSLGRSQGTRLLETLCRFSMNPESAPGSGGGRVRRLADGLGLLGGRMAAILVATFYMPGDTRRSIDCSMGSLETR
jgi:hypothetical protein